MQGIYKTILEYLGETQYVTAKKLADDLEISSKTVRTRIKELNEIGDKYGFCVESRAGYGFHLVMQEGATLSELLRSQILEDRFSENENRVNYLLAYLVNNSSYIKVDDLCDFFYVSRTTLQSCLKKVVTILNYYRLDLERRPHYGIRVVGKEFDIRTCIGECFLKRNFLKALKQEFQQDELNFIGRKVIELTRKYHVNISEEMIENLVIQIYVGCKRIKREHFVNMSDVKFQEREGDADNTAEFLSELYAFLMDWQDISFTEDEKKYVKVHLSGRYYFGSLEENEQNFIIREEIDRLVLHMLELIRKEFQIDFSRNLELRLTLNQHMVPFDIRMRYHIRIENSQLEEICKNFQLPYMMAKRCSPILTEYYGYEPSDEELGNIALIFALAMEQCGEKISKISVLLVCASGKTSARLLKYTYEREFEKYLENIYICNAFEVQTFDFRRVEYVFTTVPLPFSLPVPVMEVGDFLEWEDITRIKHMLVSGSPNFLLEYYRPEQFWTDVQGDTPEEIITNMCRRISEERDIPDEFCEAVLRREELTGTDYGNLVAMPHPYQVMTEETFVYVAVLERQMLWNKRNVQVVFLVSVGAKNDPNLQKFYEATTQVLLDEEKIRKLIVEKNFNTLIELLQ